MTEDDAWGLFTGRVMDEDKVSPRLRAGIQGGPSLADERAIGKLCRRIAEARRKHPQFARGAVAGYCVISDELQELLHAVGAETPERQADEALDVAATAMRFVMGEHLDD